MKNPGRLRVLILLAAIQTGLVVGLPVFASDLAKERRWAEQVIDGLLDGEAVWLQDDAGTEFLGILTETGENEAAAAILLHGIGVHPNWPEVIYPLREGLLEHGITSLSLQMPILGNDAAAADYAELMVEVPGRIDAALNLLRDRGFSNISLVAHSMGATMALDYISRNPSAELRSLIVIGTPRGLQEDENVEALAQVEIPVLDLYGSADLDTVLASAGQRAAAGKRALGADYQQVRVAAANHFFQGREAALKTQVIEWLAKLD